MENSTSLTSLMIVVAIAFLVPILLHQLKLRALPVVVAEIVAGLVIGKSGFDLVTEDQWLSLLSLLGFIYLMFLSGVEIDFSSFRKTGGRGKEPNPLVISILIFVLILLLSYGLSYGLMLLGFVTEPYLMTLIIATISLGVVMPVLKEKKMMDTGLGQTVLLVTVISDFVTMILLAVYLSALAHDVTKMLLLLLFFLLVFVFYFFFRRFTNKGWFAILGKGTVQLGTRAVFALILLFVVMSETLGVENILGAFLAGVIVSLLMPNREFAHQLDTFGYGFLIPIFFVMVGVNLDLWSLFADPSILLLIPLLIFAIFISKMIPSLLLNIWYPWRKVLGSGLLMSSTLSLVIAASTIALEMGIIDEHLHGALILVAILTCLLFPVLFNKVYPNEADKRTRVSIVGINHVTMPVTRDLIKEGYDIRLYTSQTGSEEERSNWNPETAGQSLKVEEVTLDSRELEERGVYDTDIIVFGSMDDDANIRLAEHAGSLGLERIIVRVEDPEKQEMAQRQGMAVFSTLYASRILLKALIEHPSAVKLITQQDDSLQEIRMNNPAYHNSFLRDLSFLKRVLVLRIYRGESFIIPHGNTQIQVGDRLLASGEAEQMHIVKRHLE